MLGNHATSLDLDNDLLNSVTSIVAMSMELRFIVPFEIDEFGPPHSVKSTFYIFGQFLDKMCVILWLRVSVPRPVWSSLAGFFSRLL